MKFINRMSNLLNYWIIHLQKLRVDSLTGISGIVLMLAVFASVQPAQAIVILEGSDATGFHCFPGGAQTYTDQLLAALKGTSTLPVLVLSNFLGGCTASSSVPHVVTASLGSAVPSFNNSNYSALYIMSPGGCCDDGRTLVSLVDQANIATFIGSGGSLGIMDFQGGHWGTALGFVASPADVGGEQLPFTSGGPNNFDSNTVTAAGLALGITAAPDLLFFGHQAYRLSGFPGYTALITPPASAYPSGYGTVIALLCQPPTISGETATPNILWSPNHKMVPITVSYSMTSQCGGSCVLSVSSNEAANGTGDGNTNLDTDVIDDHHVQVRAERAGNLIGRIYTITITCTNSGGTTSKSVTVTVPHDKS